jgi:hypothetical protein
MGDDHVSLFWRQQVILYSFKGVNCVVGRSLILSLTHLPVIFYWEVSGHLNFGCATVFPDAIDKLEALSVTIFTAKDVILNIKWDTRRAILAGF